MQLCSGAVGVHCHEGACQDGESVQSMAVNAKGTILAVLTQLRIHFWSAGPKIVYLTSLDVPGTSLEENPALYVLWRQQRSHLAVVSTRHVAFFEADINVKTNSFLYTIERGRTASYLHHVDAASRVCYSSEMSIMTGLVTSAVAAGPYAFLVTTTAGVVYVVGWHKQGILHQWTTVGLQGGGHTFRCIAKEEERVPATAAGSEADLSATGAVPVNSLPSVAQGSSRTLALSLPRVDPLQQWYHRDPRVPIVDDMGASTRHIVAAAGSAPAGIRPPGTAVRGSEMPLEYNGTATTLLSLPENKAGSTAAPSEESAENLVVGRHIVSGDTHTTTMIIDAEDKRRRRPSLLLPSFTGTNGFSAAQRSVGAEWLSGTILHASFAPRLRVLSFVFSSGSVLLCRTSCGTNFTHEKVMLQGCVAPILSACMVAINVRHLLLAVCTQAGAISCRRIDGATLAVQSNPLWKGLRGVSDAVFNLPVVATSTSQSLGLIAGMEWSPSEELLCLAFYRHGMVLVHYSGAVVTRHLSGPVGASFLRTPREFVAGTKVPLDTASTVGSKESYASPLSNDQEGGMALGCSVISWKPDGTRLWVAVPRQSRFFSTQVSRVLTVDTVGPTCGNHSPLALLTDNALFLISVSETPIAQGGCEMVLPPDDYLREQYPLLYGAVSSDGSWIACAGQHGLALFNRDRHSWGVTSKEVEKSFSCVADPVWLRDVAVAVPTLQTDTKTFDLIVFSASVDSPVLVAARVELDGRPSQLSSVHQDHRGDGFIVVVDCSQMVHVFRYDVFIDVPTESSSPRTYVSVTPVQRLVLTHELSNPLRIIPLCLACEEDEGKSLRLTQGPIELRLLLHQRGDHTLVWIRGKHHAAGHAGNCTSDGGGNHSTSPNDNMTHVDAVGEPMDPAKKRFVFRCWVDRSAPVSGALLVIHEEEQGLVMYQVLGKAYRKGERPASVTYRMEVTATQGSESLPVCPSPFDGYMLGVATDASAARLVCHGFTADAITRVGQVSSRPKLVLRPIIYAHRILSLLLKAAIPSTCVPPKIPNVQEINRPSATLTPSSSSMHERTSAEVNESAIAFIWDRVFFYWLERMRLNDTFSVVLDYFLHTALNESPPAAVPGLGRRSAVRAAISLLRNYPEFYSIIVGCVRKIDFTRWHLVLDFLGTPMDLFHECVAHNRYVEAVHLVRVIMMGSYGAGTECSPDRIAVMGNGGSMLGHNSNDVTPLQQASQCAVELFVRSVANGSYTAAYDIMRFMALLEGERGMPVAGGLDFDGDSGSSSEGSAGTSERFLTRWLRHLTFRSFAFEDSGASVTVPYGRGKAKGILGNDSLTEMLRIEGFSTLAFAATPDNGTESGRVSEETQRQLAVHHMFRQHKALPEAVHQESLRLLRTGYVTQLAKLMETFSFSIVEFLRAICDHPPSTAPSLAAVADVLDKEGTRHHFMPCLCDIFDGLHKELGLPRGFSVSIGPTVEATWGTWLVGQQAAQVAGLPGVVDSTNPRVWTVVQSALYASPSLLSSVQSLHQLYAPLFVYDLAFCVLLMHKSNLILLLMSCGASSCAHVQQSGNAPTEPVSKDTASPMKLIDILEQLDSLLAVPENAGYKSFLHDVFTSLPPSALHATTPKVVPRAGVADAASPKTDAVLSDVVL